MVIDCHTHVSAFCAGCGSMSAKLQASLPFRFMRWRLGIEGSDGSSQRAIARTYFRTLEGTPEIDAGVVLAFDAVYDEEARRDEAQTHLHVSNDYAMALAVAHPKALFGCSVHPYRKDAVAELERCVRAGAVLMKWLPITQGFDPADSRCIPLYEAMAHYGLPLLCHTGWEQALPTIDASAADPLLLEEAIQRGVKVIAAHCGTRAVPGDVDYLPNWARMAREHEHFYGDTAALNLPARWYAWPVLLEDEALRSKLVHGSDWPIISIPPLGMLMSGRMELLAEDNWMRRDVLIKRELGLDAGYWGRAGQLLRIPAIG